VPLLDIQPMPPAATHGASLEAWVWIAVVLAVIVASGLVLASRR
jgi:hypothetical protein